MKEMSFDNKNSFTLDDLFLEFLHLVKTEKAFKSGYVLTKILPQARLTTDIDLSVASKKEYEVIKEKLNNIGNSLVSRGFVYDFYIKDTVDENHSGGIVFRDYTGKVVLGMDISLHNLSYGICDTDLKITTASTFSIERMLSDKLMAILSKKRFRRTKDLADVYLIATAVDFEYSELVFCLKKRGFTYDMLDVIPFDEVIIQQYMHAWEHLNLVDASTEEDLSIDFNKALRLFYAIVMPLKLKIDKKEWNHLVLNWRS